MDIEEFSRKRTVLEKGIKSVQFKFVILPVVFGVALANLLADNSLSFMLVSALLVVLTVGVPLQVYVSRKISSVAKEMGFACAECGKTFPLKGLKAIESTGKCPACGSQVISQS